VKDPFHGETRRPAGRPAAASIGGLKRSRVLLRGTDLAAAALVAQCVEKIELGYAERRVGPPAPCERDVARGFDSV